MSIGIAHIIYDINMEFGKNFRSFRKENGYTQNEIAAKLGIAQSNVSDWENDVSRPEYENLIKLASFYGVTVGELLGVEK